MAGIFDLQINQGEDYLQYFQWLQMDGVTPVDITNFLGSCQIRSSAQSTGILVTPLFTIVDSVHGVFSLSLTNAQAAAIPTSGGDFLDVSRYVYDVVLYSPAGTAFRVLNGRAIISPEVTR